MRRLINFSGGRNLVNEDLEALQVQHRNASAVYGGYGNIVVSGCRVTPSEGNYNISAGLIYFEGLGFNDLVRFNGATNVDLSSPKWIRLNTTDIINRYFSILNSVLPGLREHTLTIVDNGGGPAIAIGTSNKHTSGRSTKEQVADALNTKGIYSTVRHPLYLGNYFMWIGIVMFTYNIWFVLVVSFMLDRKSVV